MFKRIVLFGDVIGVPQLLEVLPSQLIKGFVISSIRPQYFTELKLLAGKYEVPLFIQPKYGSDSYASFISEFKKMNFDLLLCNCYSMIIRKDILDYINFNAINIHWALLPLNRGPNPTQWAIIRGEKKTGVSIHYMDEGLDSGDVIAQTEENILGTDTWVTVNERLKIKSQEFLKRHIPEIICGKNNRVKQDEKFATQNTRLTPDSPLIDFEKMCDEEIVNLIRAQVHPLKGAFIKDNGNRIYFDRYLNKEKVAELRRKYAKH